MFRIWSTWVLDTAHRYTREEPEFQVWVGAGSGFWSGAGEERGRMWRGIVQYRAICGAEREGIVQAKIKAGIAPASFHSEKPIIK